MLTRWRSRTHTHAHACTHTCIHARICKKNKNTHKFSHNDTHTHIILLDIIHLFKGVCVRERDRQTNTERERDIEKQRYYGQQCTTWLRLKCDRRSSATLLRHRVLQTMVSTNKIYTLSYPSLSPSLPLYHYLSHFTEVAIQCEYQ